MPLYCIAVAAITNVISTSKIHLSRVKTQCLIKKSTKSVQSSAEDNAEQKYSDAPKDCFRDTTSPSLTSPRMSGVPPSSLSSLFDKYLIMRLWQGQLMSLWWFNRGSRPFLSWILRERGRKLNLCCEICLSFGFLAVPVVFLGHIEHSAPSWLCGQGVLSRQHWPLHHEHTRATWKGT